MKHIIVFCTLIALIAGADWAPPSREEFVKVREECAKSEKVPPEAITKLDRMELPDDPAVKCLFRCVGAKVGTWDDKKGYDAERVQKIHQASGVEGSIENLKKCFQPVQGDPCQWAFNSMKCLWDNKYVTIKQS